MLVNLVSRSLAGSVVIASALFAGVAGHAPAYAHSDSAAPFLGGIMAGRVLTNMQNQRAQQTRAMQEMAGEGGSTGGHSRPTSHSPAQLSPQERLQQLDQLAAGGYITPQEYKARREAILNAM